MVKINCLVEELNNTNLISENMVKENAALNLKYKNLREKFEVYLTEEEEVS